MAKKKGLTDKQQRFVKEYLVDYNATAAYKRAGYAPKRAKENAYHLMTTNNNIKEAISRATEKATKKVEVSVEKVLNMLLKEAEYYGQGSTQSARVQAITQVGRYLSMFSDNTNVNLTDLAGRMRKAEKRIAEEKVKKDKEKEE